MKLLLLCVSVSACYAPSPPTGAPCGVDGSCPEGLTCVPSTQTCERAAESDARVMDAAVDAPPDAPRSGPPVTTFLVAQQTTVSGDTVSAAVGTNVPAGTLVVVEVAARGDLPVTIADTSGNTWLRAIDVANASLTTVAGVYYSILTKPLTANDGITATVTGASDRTRSIAVFQVANGSALDQTVSAQVTSTNPTVVSAATTTSNQVAFGVISTGFNTPVTFAPDNGFVEVFEYAATLSSGSFNHKPITGIGPQTFSVTTQNGTAAYAIVLATFR